MIDLALMCLALTVYHEARGEPTAGQYAVAQVVMERVADDRWPSTVCAVVSQDSQFSWVSRVPPIPMEPDAWHTAVKVSQDTMNDISIAENMSYILKPTHYHHHSIQPIWTYNVRKIRRIGNHVFYR